MTEPARTLNEHLREAREQANVRQREMLDSDSRLREEKRASRIHDLRNNLERQMRTGQIQEAHRTVSQLRELLPDDADLVLTQTSLAMQLGCRAILNGHCYSVTGVAFVGGDSDQVVSASEDYSLRRWSLSESRQVARVGGHAHWVHGVAVSADGRRAASVAGHMSSPTEGMGPTSQLVPIDCSLRLWDLETCRPLGQATDFGLPLHTVAFAPDGHHVLVGGAGGFIALHDAATAARVRRFGGWFWGGHSRSVMAVAFSPDGRMAASASADQTVQRWTPTGRSLGPLSGHAGAVRAVAFSPDGARIATGGDDKTLRLWDAASGRPLACGMAHAGSVNAVAISRDGRWLVSVGSDARVRVADLATRPWPADGPRQVAVMTGHIGAVLCVAISPDCRYVVTGGADRTIRCWELPA